MYLLKPDARGSVTLRSPDPRVPPVIDHGFLSEPHDLARLASGVRADPHARAGRRAPGMNSAPARTKRSMHASGARWRGIFHPTGTCAIGAVVDTQAVSSGVWTGSSSRTHPSCPTIPRANTNLSTIAIAELMVDRLRAA